MRRIIFLSALSLIALPFYGQNWEPIYVEEALYYSSESTPQTFGVYADTVNTYNATEEIRISNYANAIDECGEMFCNECYRLETSFFQDKMVIESEGVITFQNPDTFHIHTLAEVGDSWIFSSSNSEEVITASLTEKVEMLILGNTDSIKVIALSNGGEIQLSKHHGIVHWTDASDTYSLVSIPKRNPAEMYLQKRDVYDYNVGDILVYLRQYNELSEVNMGFASIQINEIIRAEVVELSEGENSRTIQFSNHKIKHYHQDWAGMVESYYNYSAYTSSLTKDFNLENQLYQIPNNSLWKGVSHPFDGESVVEVSQDIMSDEVVELRPIEHQLLNGRKVLSYGLENFEFDFDETSDLLNILHSNSANPNYAYSHEKTAQHCDYENSYLLLPNDTVAFHEEALEEQFSHFYQVAEGLGELFYYNNLMGLGSFAFEESTRLIGYQKGDESAGFIPNPEIMETVDVKNKNSISFSLYPNPAEDYSIIQLPESVHATANLYDLSGRRISRFEIVGDTYRLSTTQLEKGIYILEIQTNSGSAKRRIVKQ